MDFSKSLRVSSSGLTAQRQRLNAISSNIANVNTVRTAEGGPYRRKADADGYVAYPDINIIDEMTNMIQATRSYEANVSAIKATTDMALSALQIGR